MAGIAILIDILRKNPCLNPQTIHSCQFFTPTLAASAAAATFSTPFVSRATFGIGGKSVAYCDAGAILSDDAISSIESASRSILKHNTPYYNTKEYYIQLKPLYSAFEWKFFAMTTLRSFLLHFLPIMEPRVIMDEDDDDFLQNTTEDGQVDLVVPFKKSVKQVIRESTVVTTRRILERLSVHYVSQRMAWKLLKDVSVSAVRKAGRGMSLPSYFFRVCRSTFRGHFLGVAASWLVQVGIDIYRFLSSIYKTKEDSETINVAEVVQRLQKNIHSVTITCGVSLIFASIGAGVGSVIIRPSTGQWIGCAIGDLSGPVIVAFALGKATSPTSPRF